MQENRFSFTAIHDPDADRLLQNLVQSLQNDLQDCPTGTAVFLGGSYGRGDGSVLKTAQGPRLYNDLDFFVFLPEWRFAARNRLHQQLEHLARKWRQILGIDVDFSPAKGYLELLRHGHRLIYQELRNGHVFIAGNRNMLSHLPEDSPDRLPFSEALRLLLNRGIGLCLAGQELQKPSPDAGFILRNFSKLILGCCDALLIARRSYRWKRSQRSALLQTMLEPSDLLLYQEAEQFKCLPTTELPSDPAARWHDLCSFFIRMAALAAGSDISPDSFAAAVRGGCRSRHESSLIHWLNYGRKTGHWGLTSEAQLPPVARLLIRLYSTLLTSDRSIPTLSGELFREWQLFN